jgi:hypothetical protein
MKHCGKKKTPRKSKTRLVQHQLLRKMLGLAELVYALI